MGIIIQKLINTDTFRRSYVPVGPYRHFSVYHLHSGMDGSKVQPG